LPKKISEYSANVILAKARAMYGRALTPADYSRLLNVRSVSEIAAYLKHETHYAEVLADINESTVHRGHLEALLRRKLWIDYGRLVRYDNAVGMHLSSYIIQREEIGMILLCLRLMNAGRGQELVLSAPPQFTALSKLNPVIMGQAENFEELLEAAAGTGYHKLLRPLAMTDRAPTVTQVETVLYTHLFGKLNTLIAGTSGEQRRQLQSLCGIQQDIQNVTRILRLKSYFQADAETIRSNLIPAGGRISKKAMAAMIGAPTAEEAREIFFSTAAGRRIPQSLRQYEFNLVRQAPYFGARYHIHFSTWPMVVLMAYMLLLENELDDIVNIIEGVRYRLPGEEIRTMLVAGAK